jgi:eukaryotic-like serine/threonine-protein kinase
MSPEQARGKSVDKRTDIWAFGCVVYEMLTGHPAFRGETLSDTIAAVIEREPDWSPLSTAPPNLRRLVDLCIRKDPQRRIRDIGDAELVLDYTIESAPATHRALSSRAAVAAAAAGMLVIALITTTTFRYRRAEARIDAPITRTAIVLPPDLKLVSGNASYPLAISHDGQRLAFVAQKEGRRELYVRELGSLETKPIPGTSGAGHPFFSSDERWVSFFTAESLQKVELAGGPPVRICTLSGMGMGGTWGADNVIIFVIRDSGLFQVDARGGTPRRIQAPASAAWPEMLPDGKTVLFTVGQEALATIPVSGGKPHIVARVNDSRLAGPDMLGRGDVAQARFAPSGHLVYGQARGIVRAAPFDLQSLTISGSPVSLLDSVERAANGGGVYFAASSNGTFVYAPTGERHQVVWVDRQDNEQPVTADREAFRNPRISPDGKRIAVAVNDDTRRSDIWVYDTERGTRHRLTNVLHNLAPVWTPDGTRITYSSNGEIAELPADGTGEKQTLLATRGERYGTSWSPDGRTLLFQSSEPTGIDLWVLLRGGTTRALLARRFDDREGTLREMGRLRVG